MPIQHHAVLRTSSHLERMNRTASTTGIFQHVLLQKRHHLASLRCDSVKKLSFDWKLCLPPRLPHNDIQAPACAKLVTMAISSDGLEWFLLKNSTLIRL